VKALCFVVVGLAGCSLEEPDLYTMSDAMSEVTSCDRTLVFDQNGEVTIPDGCTRMTVLAWGGGGNAPGGSYCNGALIGAGGGGAYVAADLIVSPGETYIAYPATEDTRGGDASALYQRIGATSRLVLVAAGGGGGGCGSVPYLNEGPWYPDVGPPPDGGPGGALGGVGINGVHMISTRAEGSWEILGGTGGTQTAGGTGGHNPFSHECDAPDGGPFDPNGYASGMGCVHGGWGGQGYFGGGGGGTIYSVDGSQGNLAGGSGGAGGSSFIDPLVALGPHGAQSEAGHERHPGNQGHPDRGGKGAGAKGRSITFVGTTGRIIVRLGDSQIANADFRIAEITSPLPKTSHVAGTLTFQWSAGLGVTSYKLDVGTTPGASDLRAGAETLALEETVLISRSGPIYVRLWSKQNDHWFHVDTTYTIIGEGPPPIHWDH
jgi:hypothetical protein